MIAVWLAAGVLADSGSLAAITGSTNATLDPVVSAGASTVEINGDLAGQLSPATLTTAAALRISGGTTATLEAATTEGAGEVDLSAALAGQLEPASLAANGTLAAVVIQGSVAQALEPAGLLSYGFKAQILATGIRAGFGAPQTARNGLPAAADRSAANDAARDATPAVARVNRQGNGIRRTWH